MYLATSLLSEGMMDGSEITRADSGARYHDRLTVFCRTSSFARPGRGVPSNPEDKIGFLELPPLKSKKGNRPLKLTCRHNTVGDKSTVLL